MWTISFQTPIACISAWFSIYIVLSQATKSLKEEQGINTTIARVAIESTQEGWVLGKVLDGPRWCRHPGTLAEIYFFLLVLQGALFRGKGGPPVFE